MLRIALLTIRARWIAFVGSFIALTLGVGLVATMGLALAAAFETTTASPPGRYRTDAVVVRAGDTLKARIGEKVKSRELKAPRGLDLALAAKVTALGHGVQDHVFYAQLAGDGPKVKVGRPWSVAPFVPATLAVGRAPATPTEVVVPAGGGRPGDTVRVMTAQGPRTYRVAGVSEADGTSNGAEPAVFFADAEAARLSPRIDAVVTRTPAGAVRAAVGSAAEVVTGDRVGSIGASGDEEETLDGAKIMLGTAGGICGFVAVFVVPSTFALAVAQP